MAAPSDARPHPMLDPTQTLAHAVALGVRRLFSSARAQRRLHRGAALAMAGAVGTMIAREI